MFLKKAIYLVIALFPLSSAPSGIKRDQSTSSLDSYGMVEVNASGEVTLGQLAGRPASPRGSAAATPLSDADYEHVRATPAPEGAAVQPALHLTLAAVVQDQTPAPETPQNSLAVSQLTTEPAPSPKSTHSKASGAQSIAPCPVAAAAVVQDAQGPQQLPVDPLPTVTPSATPRCAPHAAGLAAQPPLSTPPLTEQQRMQLQAQLGALRNNPVPMPQAAQRPMQVAHHPPLERKKSSHAISIAPESPARNLTAESDKPTNCCMPFIICWKELWSKCSKPTH